jgi:hypothetical protein
MPQRSFLVAVPIFIFMLGTGGLSAQQAGVTDDIVVRQPVPAPVIANAVKAVQAVGDQALRGEFKEVIGKLYPRFRKRAVKRVGGEAALTETFRKMMEDLAKTGITVTKFEAEPALHAFDIPGFNEWLVFVPTKRTIRFIDPETKKVQRGVLKDYQIAIRKKTEDASWTFLNGSTLEIRELRALFPSLPSTPDELGLPSKEFDRLP